MLNIDEARMAIHDKNCIDNEVPNLLMKNEGNKFSSYGSKGSFSKSKNKPIFHMPSFSNVVVDTIGAECILYLIITFFILN